MEYTKKLWKTPFPITDAKYLNKIEKGIDDARQDIDALNAELLANLDPVVANTILQSIITNDAILPIYLGNDAYTGQLLSTTVTLTASEIVGTDAGCIGHADGAILVAAPGTGYAQEFVSALLIYDFDTATYTGGADNAVIQVGVNGAQVAVTGAITGASLLEASEDKILRLGSTATELVYADNGAISLTGTALTQPGAYEEFTLQLTVAEDTGGDVTLTLNEVPYTITLTADTVEANAQEIKEYIDVNVTTHTAEVTGDTVTVTAVVAGSQTDATYALDTANSSAGTVIVTQEGADFAAGVLRAHVTYRVHTTQL